MKENRQPVSQHIKQRTREWLKKADHELAYLKNSPFHLDDPPTDTACKMAHWVAEYSLKSVLIFNKQKSKIHGHDIASMISALIEIGAEFEALKNICLQLADYKEDITYPLDPPREITVGEANVAIRNAEDLYDFITAWLYDKGL